jgi:hypothetical protein
MNIKQSHHAHQTEIFALLNKIKDMVLWHGDGEALTWEDVGDLVHVENSLGDLLAFLKGKE